MDPLDSPTIYRVGAPTLGTPMLSLSYRSVGLHLVWWRRWWNSLRSASIRLYRWSARKVA